MRAVLPDLTEKQRLAWVEAVIEAQRHIELEELPTQIDHYQWAVRVQHEQRPGRGHDLDAVFMSGDYAVSIHLGVYGETSVAVAELSILHNSADEECDCKACVEESAEPTVRCPGCDLDPVGYAPHNGKGDCPPIQTDTSGKITAWTSASPSGSTTEASPQTGTSGQNPATPKKSSSTPEVSTESPSTASRSTRSSSARSGHPPTEPAPGAATEPSCGCLHSHYDGVCPESNVRCPGCDLDPVGYAPHNGKGDCPPIHTNRSAS